MKIDGDENVDSDEDYNGDDDADDWTVTTSQTTTTTCRNLNLHRHIYEPKNSSGKPEQTPLGASWLWATIK